MNKHDCIVAGGGRWEDGVIEGEGEGLDWAGRRQLSGLPQETNSTRQQGKYCQCTYLVKVKGTYSFLWMTPFTELRSVTCHMGSHSVTCHPTQVSAPRLNPSHRGLVKSYNYWHMQIHKSVSFTALSVERQPTNSICAVGCVRLDQITHYIHRVRLAYTHELLQLRVACFKRRQFFTETRLRLTTLITTLNPHQRTGNFVNFTNFGFYSVSFLRILTQEVKNSRPTENGNVVLYSASFYALERIINISYHPVFRLHATLFQGMHYMLYCIQLSGRRSVSRPLVWPVWARNSELKLKS